MSTEIKSSEYNRLYPWEWVRIVACCLIMDFIELRRIFQRPWVHWFQIVESICYKWRIHILNHLWILEDCCCMSHRESLDREICLSIFLTLTEHRNLRHPRDWECECLKMIQIIRECLRHGLRELERSHWRIKTVGIRNFEKSLDEMFQT